VSRKLSRRTFLEQLGSVTAASLTAGVVGIPASADAAKAGSKKPPLVFSTNGDEDAYPNKIASYTKGLSHDDRGEVDLPAYGTFLKAITTGKPADFEAVPLGGRAKFANPRSACDSWTCGGEPRWSRAYSVPGNRTHGGRRTQQARVKYLAGA
jgi:hypothetical protein